MVGPYFELRVGDVENAYLVLHNCHFQHFVRSDLPVVLLNGCEVGEAGRGPDGVQAPRILSDGSCRANGISLEANVPADLLRNILSDFAH